MATRNPPGTGMLRLVAAMLLIGGPILALAFRSWGVGSLVFGLGAIVLGYGRSGSAGIAANASSGSRSCSAARSQG
jgi:hypothetical protein